MDEIPDKEREKSEKINTRDERRRRRKVPALWRNAVIASPCIGTCTYDPFQEPTVCMGCERTYDEISMWETYGDEQRQAVLDRINWKRDIRF